MKVWRVTANDDCEGRSRRTVGYFKSMEDALKVHASNYGNAAMGGPGDPKYSVKEVDVFEGLMDFVASEPNMDHHTAVTLVGVDHADEVLRLRALRKLTTAERRVLGL